ncbi:MAG: hypothetical protein ACJAZS_000041 [Alteromonas naphthalenivorans]|jgi:hypothetical protein
MKPVSLQKQSVAWFKLAECVGRGEKERALSLLRLLTYSLDNKPFVKQLEADILSFFEDSQALTEYVSAAHMFYKEGNVIEASAVYEKLIALEQKTEFLEKIVMLYSELKDESKIVYYQKKLYLKYLSNGFVAKAIAVLKVCEDQLDGAEKIDMYKKLIFAAITHKYTQQKTITEYLYKVLDGLLRFGSDAELQLFLSDLKALNAMWHKDAAEYLKQ